MATYYTTKPVKVNRLTVGQRVEFNHSFCEIESICTDRNQESFTIYFANDAGAIFRKAEDTVLVQFAHKSEAP